MDVRQQVLDYVYTLRDTNTTPFKSTFDYEMEHDSEGC